MKPDDDEFDELNKGNRGRILRENKEKIRSNPKTNVKERYINLNIKYLSELLNT